MKITRITSHVLSYPLDEPLGYSQQYFTHRSAHLVEVETDERVTGWGECFGPGNIARANRRIVEEVLAPIFLGEDPLAREALWHRAYNLLRDHGQKGMPIQALSGIDIALWDIAGRVAGLPLYRLLGGPTRERIPVYGYGMMLRPIPVEELVPLFRDEAAAIRDAGYRMTKMKIGLGREADIALARAVREGVGEGFPLAADANHCYVLADAFYVGRALDELGAYWFEEPVAPEDHAGYAELRRALKTTIAGGEAEFTRWGWRDLLAARAVGIAQPEVCGLGGITEFLKVQALCHADHVPVVNHVWGSGLAVAVNMHLLAAQPPMPGGLHPFEPMLEFDTTPNRFRDDILAEPPEVQRQVRETGGYVGLPPGPGLGVEPDRAFLDHFRIS